MDGKLSKAHVKKRIPEDQDEAYLSSPTMVHSPILNLSRGNGGSRIENQHLSGFGFAPLSASLCASFDPDICPKMQVDVNGDSNDSY